MPLTKNIRSRKIFLVAAGALLGAAVFLLVNTGASLNVMNDAWIRSGYVEKDIIQHYTGWLFYRQSPLSFPLGMSSAINYPQGAAVTYTDSVPLFAILFRLLSPILPATFQYFGLYTLCCYMLQGAAAALLLTVFCDRVLPVLLGSCLFLFSPIMIERAFRHTALASHFLILFALYLYFCNRQKGWRYRPGYLVLAGLATAIHPYFLPMIFAVLFADLLEHAVRTKKPLKPLLFLLAAFAVVGAVGFSIGAFSTPSSGGSTGYGYFCMNLNSLFNPLSCSGIVWSRVLPTLPQGLGSYDGFNYLGLGVLAAFPIAVLMWLLQKGRRQRLLSFLKNYWGLLFASACLTAFAVSNTVLANTRVLFTLPVPSFLLKLGSIFRSSGRMFYPVYYLILLFTVVFFARRWGAKIGSALLVVILAVQIWDISPALKEKRAYFTSPSPSFENPMKSEFWDAIDGRYAHMFSLDDTLVQALYPALYAADTGMTTNDGFTARFDIDYHHTVVDQELEQLLRGETASDTLYITSNRPLFFQLAEALKDTAVCAQVDHIWYVFAPMGDASALPAPSEDLLLYPHFPLRLEDLTDGAWTQGVLNENKSICTVLDNPFTQRFFDNAEYVVCEGISYKILKKDYKDAGWLMLTLDLEDAGILVGKDLTTR